MACLRFFSSEHFPFRLIPAHPRPENLRMAVRWSTFTANRLFYQNAAKGKPLRAFYRRHIANKSKAIFLSGGGGRTDVFSYGLQNTLGTAWYLIFTVSYGPFHEFQICYTYLTNSICRIIERRKFILLVTTFSSFEYYYFETIIFLLEF